MGRGISRYAQEPPKPLDPGLQIALGVGLFAASEALFYWIGGFPFTKRSSLKLGSGLLALAGGIGAVTQPDKRPLTLTMGGLGAASLLLLYTTNIAQQCDAGFLSTGWTTVPAQSVLQPTSSYLAYFPAEPNSQTVVSALQTAGWMVHGTPQPALLGGLEVSVSPPAPITTGSDGYVPIGGLNAYVTQVCSS